MEIRNIETLRVNPENHRILTDKGREMLLHDMLLGDHSSFLITPDGMIIDGNNRWMLRHEAGWMHKDVHCRILTFAEDQDGFYAIIDGEVVKENEVIPFHYVSVEALYKAYSFSRNSESAYDDPDYIANNFHKWQLDEDKVQVHFFPPASIAETLKQMEKREKAKKYQIIIPCVDEKDMDTKYNQVMRLGIQAKRKI